jgi:hypothetical protein
VVLTAVVVCAGAVVVCSGVVAFEEQAGKSKLKKIKVIIIPNNAFFIPNTPFNF